MPAASTAPTWSSASTVCWLVKVNSAPACSKRWIMTNATGSSVLSFSTATLPSQLYVLDADDTLHRQTNERVLGIPAHLLARGEMCRYTSHDGLRIWCGSIRPPLRARQGRRPVISTSMGRRARNAPTSLGSDVRHPVLYAQRFCGGAGCPTCVAAPVTASPT